MRSRFLMSLVVLLLIVAQTNAYGAENAFQRYHEANLLYGRQQYQNALHRYRSLLASQQDRIPPGALYGRIGDCLFQLADYRGALDAYNRALPRQRIVERPTTQFWIGFCHFMLGENRLAASAFLNIPTLYPQAGAWVGTAYYWAGRSYERLGDRANAADCYRKAGGAGKDSKERFALKRAHEIGNAASGQRP